MEQKKCKTKKCGKVLPEGYKNKYCENCMAKRANGFKKGIGVALAALATVVLKGTIGGKKS